MGEEGQLGVFWCCGAVVLGVSGIGIWSLGVIIMVVYSGELE